MYSDSERGCYAGCQREVVLGEEGQTHLPTSDVSQTVWQFSFTYDDLNWVGKAQAQLQLLRA
jgi:hypothetical protein